MGDINIDLNENAIFESVAFNNIFEFLYEKWFKPGTKTDMLDCGKIAMYNLPYVINGSFACEIALKSAMSEDNAKNINTIFMIYLLKEICLLYVRMK